MHLRHRRSSAPRDSRRIMPSCDELDGRIGFNLRVGTVLRVCLLLRGRAHNHASPLSENYALLIGAIALFAVLRIDLTDWTTVSRMRPHRPGSGIARWDHWSAQCRRP